MSSFRAFRITNNGGKTGGLIVEATLDELTPGDVVIKAAYSSVNYKDALAATGTGKILRRFPLIGGIDVAGTVASSTDSRWREGDRVLVTGYDLGVAHDGGYAGYVRVPADWVVRIPDGPDVYGMPWCSAPRASPPAWPSFGSSATVWRRGRARSLSPAPPVAWAAWPSPRSRGSDTT